MSVIRYIDLAYKSPVVSCCFSCPKIIMGLFFADEGSVELLFVMKEIQWLGMYLLETRFACAPVSGRRSDDLLTCACTPKHV